MTIFNFQSAFSSSHNSSFTNYNQPKMLRLLSSLLLLNIFPASSARTFTVYNGCPFTIWYVIPTRDSTDIKYVHRSQARGMNERNLSEGSASLKVSQMFTDLNVAPNVPNYPTGCVRVYLVPNKQTFYYFATAGWPLHTQQSVSKCLIIGRQGEFGSAI